MNEDQKLKDFLKTHSAETPPSALGEASAIWRKMEAKKSHRFWYWIATPSILAAGLAAGILLHSPQQGEISSEEIFLQQEWAEFVSEMSFDEDSDFLAIQGK